MFLTRARLRRERGLAALAPLLMPKAGERRVGAAHHLVWSLFADAPDRARDFLWREQEPGVFLLLSERPPEDATGLFALDEPKPFAPALEPGDRLAFMLRANPVVARGGGPGVRGKRHDVVTDALARVPACERADRRRAVIAEAGTAWLARQGEKAGFRLLSPPAVEGDDWTRIPREGAPPIAFNVLEFAGLLEVVDPDRLVAAFARGFGRAKAFGCGLMLVRRA